ncbi:hypothetical protein ACVNIS_24925 (plasmid) [Sphaerotilaceae bacterium SBD11-9]
MSGLDHAWHVRLPIEAYASRTGTRQNLAALRAAGWRLMVSARGVLRDEGCHYALDNGAWTAYQNGEPFDEAAFSRAVDKMGERADFVVVPDIVAGGLASLDYSLGWLQRLRGLGAPMALAVQDGMTPADVAPYLGAGREKAQLIFVGGTTEWKLATLTQWVTLAKASRVWVHVGRVNTMQRVRLCVTAGAASFDGSGPSRYVTETRKLDQQRRVPDLFMTPNVVPWYPETPEEQAVFDYYDCGNEAARAACE